MKKENNPKNESNKEAGIGDLLRTEREKRGLSIGQLANITRLREHFIEALENEEWERLPARVFVKGFIRSYALAIGYDSKEALRLFEKNAPLVEEDKPKPLINAKKNKSRIKYLSIPLVVIIAITLYFVAGWDKKTVEEPEIAPAYMGDEPKTPETTQPAKELEPIQQKTAIDQEVDEKPVKTEEVLSKEPIKEDTVDIPQKEIETENIKEIIKDEEPPEETTEEHESQTEVIEEEYYQTDSEIVDSKYVLTANVSTLTYVRIYVDDDPPQEYMFRPGRTPDWKGNEGFYIVVGNAAGIEFNFNGTIIKALGKEGKVKTVRLPDDFKSEWEEESD